MSEHVLIVNDDAGWFAEHLEPACSGYRFTAAATVRDALDTTLDRVDILIGLAPQLDERLLAALTDLKWVHALTAGVDNLLLSDVLDPAVVLSNSSGFHGPQMSELAILLMLGIPRNFPAMLANQQRHHWARWPQPLLADRTVCIVGLGAIAEALAKRCLAFGMTLTGVSDGRTAVPGFSAIFPRSELTTAVRSADFVVVLVPYSSSTHHIVDAHVIAAMRADTILINLARGSCVDEVAVQDALTRGALRAAALDVFAIEPLPEESPLWDTPGLTITPHIGGMSDVYREQVLPIVIAHLQAWSSGGGTALPGLITREVTT